MVTACGSTVLVMWPAWARKAERTQRPTVNLRRNECYKGEYVRGVELYNQQIIVLCPILTTPRGHVNLAWPCNISCLFVRLCSSFGTRKSDLNSLFTFDDAPARAGGLLSHPSANSLPFQSATTQKLYDSRHSSHPHPPRLDMWSPCTR